MSEVSKGAIYCRGVKHCTVIPIKDQKAMSEVSKVHTGPQYRVMLLMSKVLKVHTGSLNTEQC